MPVAGPVGRGGCLPFLICSPWKVGIDAFGIPSPGSWLDRTVVVHFNLDYSYPNMKNSDRNFLSGSRQVLVINKRGDLG